MRPLRPYLLALTLGASGHALGQVTVDGYVVTFPVQVRLPAALASLSGVGQNIVTDITRLRLRPSADISEGTFVRLEVEATATYLSAPRLVLAPSFTRGQVVDLTWTAFDRGRWTIQHSIDRLFVKTVAGPLDLMVGRQRIAWGAGRVWNPTDLFNPISPANFSKVEKDGVDAVAAVARVGDLTDLTAVWNPQQHASSSAGVRMRTNWEEVDVSAMGGRFDGHWVIGADVTGSMWDAGVRFEGVRVVPATAPAFVRFIVGVDNQFTGRWYGMAEFLYNGEGATEPGRYDHVGLLSGRVLQAARRYLIVQSSYLVHPLATVQASLLRNLDDRSGYGAATLSISVTDESAFALGGQFPFGDPSSEYWYQPRTLYLRADLFF